MTNRAPLNTAIVLLSLPVPYVGSYFALVMPAEEWPRGRYNEFVHRPIYRVGGDWAKFTYWPLEKIDRKVRPKAWTAGRNFFQPID